MGARLVAARAGRTALRPQRRRPADRRPRPRRRAARAATGVIYFGIEDASPGAARAAARLRRQALPPLRPPLRLRARLRRPPRPLLLPQLRRRAAAPRTSPRPRSSCTGWTARGRRCARPRGELELELPLPGLYNVYNALAAIAAGAAARASRRSGSRAALERDAGGLRPGRDDRGRRRAGLDPADQEPGRRQRGAADAAARGRRAAADRPLDRAQRPDRRRPRRLLDLGRRLRAARRTACGGSSAPGRGRRRWRCG